MGEHAEPELHDRFAGTDGRALVSDRAILLFMSECREP
jgi:hypothetical protein